MAKPKGVWKQEYLAWAAGFFEGEGGVNIQKRVQKVSPSYSIRAYVTNMNPMPLARLQFIFGGTIREVKQVGKSFASGKTIFRWTVSSKQALNFLRRIKPYLSSKGAEVTLGIQLEESVKYRTRGRPSRGVAVLEAEEIAYHESLYYKLRQLNRKGKRLPNG